jgi:hypothetical protein
MIRPNSYFACGFVAPLVLGCLATAAQITPVSQSRSITGDSNVLGPPKPQQDIQELAAANFEAFDQSLVTSASSPNGNTSVQAFQQSAIDDCSLAAEGGFTAFAQNSPPGVFAYSVGISVYQVTFSVSEPTLCRVVGSLNAAHGTLTRVVLHQPPTSLIDRLADNASIGVAQQRFLAPGQYTFMVQALGTASVQDSGTHETSGSFNMRLTTCFVPADLNIDGVVNIDDLLGVIGAWGPCVVPAGQCIPDINLDGVVNVDDLLALINAWG